MTTVRSIITSTLRLCGAYESSETPDPDVLQAAEYALTTMIDGWNNDSTVIYSRSPVEFTFIPGQQTYTLGVGGQWDTTPYSDSRPIRVEGAYTTYLQPTISNNIDIPIEIMNSYDWANIKVKSMGNQFP